MQTLSRPTSRTGADQVIHRLVDRLSLHALWDAFLLTGPPGAAVIFLLILLFRAGWLTAAGAIGGVTLVVILAAVAIWLRRRPLLPSTRGAARLIDQQAGAKDHFLTLATIDPASQPGPLLARLRLQTEGFVHRVELGRDFPYQMKRSAYWSFGVSLLAAVLIYFALPVVPDRSQRASAQQRLAQIVEQMAARPSLRALAQELKELAAKLDEPKTPSAEKQAAIEKMEQRIEEQKKEEPQGEGKDLLGEAANALNGMEKEQQVAGGQGEQKQENGAGGIQSNASQDGQGENQQGKGTSGNGQGESGAQLSQEKIDQGKMAKADPKQQGDNKNQAGDAKNDQNQPDPNQPSKDPTKEKAGKAGGSKDGAGKQQASEEPPPQGAPQSERFYKPGEGKEGLAGKGYVTVQLPEELVAEGKGESGATKNAKAGRSRTQVPVSNVPLPAHVPNAPMEKQQVPIEYRGILR